MPRVTCVGRDRSDSRLGDLETGERTAAFKHDGLVTPTHPLLLDWLHHQVLITAGGGQDPD